MLGAKQWATIALLLSLSCGPRQTIAPTPAVTPPPSIPTVTNYWYSQAQKNSLAALAAINPSRFRPMFVNGAEYTECRNAATPVGRFKDYVLVAQTNSGPCAPNAGEWE